jgi:hypothetical protein
MAHSLLDLFRVLSEFSPARVSLKDAPWDDYVDWAIGNGLAPLAAYNLEYRLVGGDAPEWVRDRLLSVYQGTVNDNVMKFVSFKRAVGELQGRRLLLLGAGSYAEALYPHVAFRPVPELRLRVETTDLEPFTGYLAGHGFKPLDRAEEGAQRVLSDDHTPLLLYTELLGPKRKVQEREVLERAMPIKVYGTSIFRPDLEDSILLSCLEQARAGYQVPMISFVDLRELLLGSPSLQGPFARPLDVAALVERAASWRIERALFASLAVLEKLFPQTTAAIERVTPKIPRATRLLLERAVVQPVSRLGSVTAVRGADRLRRLLAGG